MNMNIRKSISIFERALLGQAAKEETSLRRAQGFGVVEEFTRDGVLIELGVEVERSVEKNVGKVRAKRTVTQAKLHEI